MKLIYNDKRVFFTPVPTLMPYLDRLIQSPLNEVEIPSIKVRDLCRYKEMRFLIKDKQLIKIYRDGRGNSLLKCKPFVKVIKNGKGFDFLF